MKLPNQAFNAAVTSMTRRVWLRGYDISDNPALAIAPGMPGSAFVDKHAYFADIERRGRVTVFTGGSDATIFGEPEINYDFRAWHEWTHYILHAGFDLDGELAVAHRQCEDIARVFGHGHEEWHRWIMAEVYGQALYYKETGHFPYDQVTFDQAWIIGG